MITIHLVGPETKEVVSEATLKQVADLSAPAKEALQFNEAIYQSVRNNTWKKK